MRPFRDNVEFQMGKRYTQEEIDQIQALTNEGLKDGQIAVKLDRSENGVRNIRYRMNLKANTKESLQQLRMNQIKYQITLL